MQADSFGHWLRRRRKALDLTREGLADRVGCAAATIRKIEAEERRPSAQIAERLAEIFNIPISERANFLRFARGSPGSTPQELEEAPWRAPSTPPRSNIPSSITSFIGRERDLELVHGYLTNADIRLVSLIGPPGIGKTRLSLETARLSVSDFPDGVFFVALAPLDDSALIASTIVQTLGYVEAKNLPADKQLLNSIGNKQILLVLDNCEHLIENAALLVSDLLPACPRLKILATSREALRIPGEWIYSVPTLNTPKANLRVDLKAIPEFPSLQLFSERARAVRSSFTLNSENLQTVISICAQLDGLPLAIELISARIRLMSPQVLLERLANQFVLSADGMRAISARQKTLNNAIGWSYNFLTEEEQKVFASLSVFSGGFTTEIAEEIFGDIYPSQSISELIHSLADKSLLQRESGTHNSMRYQMLVTIQKYAQDKLQSTGLEAHARDRHLAYFLDLAKRGEEEIHGPAQIEWIGRLENEYDNFRAALEWCVSKQNTESALRLISSLSWYWGQWHHNSEIRGWFDRIRALPNVSTYPALYAQLLNHIGHSSWLSGDFHHARSVLDESIAVWRKLGAEGEQGMAEAMCSLGMVVHSIDSDYITARSFFEQSLGLYQKCDDRRGMAFASFNIGWVDDHMNQDETARQMLEQSLDLFSRLGDLWGMGNSSRFLGQLFLKQSNYEKAKIYFDQHLKIDEQLRLRPGVVIALGNLGDLYRHQGDFSRAEQYYHASLDMCREYGLKIDRGYNFFALGMLGLQKKDYAFARKYILQYFESGSPVSRTLAALDLCFGLAAAAGGTNQPERSAKLFGAAETLLKVIDIPYTPFDRAIFDCNIQTAREQLGKARFEFFQAEGRAMTTEQAIEYALKKD